MFFFYFKTKVKAEQEKSINTIIYFHDCFPKKKYIPKENLYNC